MAALPQNIGSHAPAPGKQPQSRRRGTVLPLGRRGVRIWVEIVVTILLLIGAGLLVRGLVAAVEAGAPFGASGLLIVKPIAQLHDELTRMGVVGATEGIAGVQQKAIVAKVECAGAHRPSFPEALANR